MKISRLLQYLITDYHIFCDIIDIYQLKKAENVEIDTKAQLLLQPSKKRFPTVRPHRKYRPFAAGKADFDSPLTFFSTTFLSIPR